MHGEPKLVSLFPHALTIDKEVEKWFNSIVCDNKNMQKLESSNKMLNGQTGWLVLPEVNMTKREPNFEVVEMYQNKTKYWNGQNVSDNKMLKWSICIWQQNIEMVNMYLTKRYWNGQNISDKKILKWSKCIWQKDLKWSPRLTGWSFPTCSDHISYKEFPTMLPSQPITLWKQKI